MSAAGLRVVELCEGVEGPLCGRHLLLLGAANRAPARRTLNQRFAAPVSGAAPTVNPAGYAEAEPDGPVPTATHLTWVEAAGLARDTDAVVVPSTELVG